MASPEEIISTTAQRSPVFLHGDRGGDRHDSQQIHTDPAMPQIVNHAAHGVDDRVRHHDDDNPLATPGLPSTGISAAPHGRHDGHTASGMTVSTAIGNSGT